MSTLADLRSTIDWFDGKIEKETDDARKDDLKSQRTAVEQKLQNMTDALSKADVKPVITHSSQQNYSNVKAIEHALASIPVFAGNNPNETETFIDRLSQAHTILVTKVDPALESTFVRCATLQLGGNVYKHMMNSTKTVDKFEDLKNFLQDHYAAKINAVQAMSKIFDISFDERLPYATYATQMTNAIKIGYRKVNAQFKEMNPEATGDIDGESMALFFGGLMLANNIRSHNFDIFRDMLKDLDKTLNAEQIASSAEYYRHRTQSNQSSTFFGNPMRGNRKPVQHRDKQHKNGKKDNRDTNNDKYDNDDKKRAQRDNDRKGKSKNSHKIRRNDQNQYRDRSDTTGKERKNESAEYAQPTNSANRKPSGNEPSTYIAEQRECNDNCNNGNEMSVFDVQHFH